MANKYILILLCCLASFNSGSMIYRRYEKEHKDFVEIVEIFKTKAKPPIHIENEKVLNNFLGRDAFKSDMNCTKEKATKKVRSTKNPIQSTSSFRPPTTRATQIPTTSRATVVIPTTVYMDHMATYSPPPFPKLPLPPTRTKSTTTRKPNEDNLFTIRPTKPTIKSNPKENENPDYTELFNWSTTTKTSNTPKISSTTRIAIIDNEQHPDDEDYGDIENEEYEGHEDEEYEEPQEDFASDEDEVDDDDDVVINRRKRFQSLRKRQARGM